MEYEWYLIQNAADVKHKGDDFHELGQLPL